MRTTTNNSKDLATGTSIERWSHWLRWILAIGAFSIIPFFTLFYVGPTWNIPLPKGVLMQAFIPLALYGLGFTQILLSTALAPKHQLKVAGILVALNTLNGVLLLLFGDDAVKSLFLITTGWVAYYMLKRHFSHDIQ